MSVQSVCGEHMSYFWVGISDKSEGGVSYPYQKQWMCSPQTEWTRVCCCYITYYTFDADLVDVLYIYTCNYFVQESSASYVISIQRSHSYSM